MALKYLIMAFGVFIFSTSLAQIQYGGGYKVSGKNVNVDMRNTVVITLLPHQKTTFFITAKQPNNSLIIYNVNTNKIVYKSKGENGKFEFQTKDDATNFIIYDTIYNKHKLLVSYGDVDLFKGVIYFKEDQMFKDFSAKVTIQTNLMPMYLDTANKHFIRFLYVPEAAFSPNCSFSVRNVPRVSYRTEPLSGDSPGEVNYHVDSNLYVQMKAYIQHDFSMVHADTTGLNSKGFVEINIDFKQYGYIENQLMSKFISQMIEYLQHEQIPPRIYKQLQYMQKYDYNNGNK